MTTAQVVKSPVTVNNSPIQDYADPDNQVPATYEKTPGFKPFTVMLLLYNTNFVSFYLSFSVTCKPTANHNVGGKCYNVPPSPLKCWRLYYNECC